MSDQFFKQPILNSPYDYPNRHWQLDESGQPTQAILEERRRAEFITPIPKPKHTKGGKQKSIVFDEGLGLSTEAQEYQVTESINRLRYHVDEWRKIKDPAKWGVTPETAKLLQHWREFQFSTVRPFFCQLEAVETAIWLTEVAPEFGKQGKEFLDLLVRANADANPGLNRLALKMATGAGKTTVMAMIIAWQTVNAVRRPGSKKYTRGFLIVAPGLTIKDRLRVLQPNDPENYYFTRELVPQDMAEDIKKAKIVITNYHAFKRRERLEMASGTRALMKGRNKGRDIELETIENEGQMLQRVIPELMAMKDIMIINDEAHHCYREKPATEADDEFADLTGADKKEAKEEAKKNKEAARLWISGLEAISRKLGTNRIIDLSATPFFLRGSGYAEGTLFPWTMSDFALMDAIECGIVKLPRVPVADNIPGSEMPKFRELWKHIGKKMPKQSRASGIELDPLEIPVELQTALEALYGHYKETFEVWQSSGIKVPPAFIIVCNNTATSKLVYDYVSGFYRKTEDEISILENGRLPLFQNFDEYGNPYSRPRTILVDSQQLESGESLDDNFRKMAADEIDRFKREIIERTGDPRAADNLTDAELLREVMNTVGKPGRLGESVRCVVSVSMLTEGWDANTVTHILGVRAFGTQLLCEQVIGRALRRQSYDLNEETGLFNVEYADIFGIPFDFAAKPVIAPPQPPRETIQVKAMRPERNALEIQFPRVKGYRVELPEERLIAAFDEDSKLTLTPDLVGPSIVLVEGLIGEGATLTLGHLQDIRKSTLLLHLTKRLIYTKWRDAGDDPKLHLFGQLKHIANDWLNNYLECKGGTYPAQLMYQELADMACERITAGITRAFLDTNPIKAVLDPYNEVGSTAHVNFNTSKADRWETNSQKCHINYVILDSDWEAEFCRIAEEHPKVQAYVKNHNLGFTVPYRMGSVSRQYIPDYIVLVDDGRGPDDLLHLVVEIKGYRGEDAKDKASTMRTYWIPGINNSGKFGRWAFAEFTDVWMMDSEFKQKVATHFNELVENAGKEHHQ
jgi:type III restriction enzyme